MFLVKDAADPWPRSADPPPRTGRPCDARAKAPNLKPFPQAAVPLALSPMVARKLKPFLRPEGYLLAAAVVLASWNRLEHSAADVIRLAPPAAGLFGLILAWRMRRRRLVFSLTVLAL